MSSLQHSRMWLVVLHYNGLDDTRRCVGSLAECEPAAFQCVVVDNASAVDRTAELAAEYPWCRFVRNEINGGWAGGNNTGIRYALEHGADWVLLLNNDTIVAPELVERLLAAAKTHPEYGVVGPVINFMDDPDAVMTEGCDFNRAGQAGFFKWVAVNKAEGRRQKAEIPHPSPLPEGEGICGTPAITECDIANGCAMMVRRDVFEKIGLIDERFFLIHEESDFCLRAREAGFRCGVINETLVWHKGSASFKRTGKAWQRYYDARNLLLLLRKHPEARRRRGGLRSYLEYLRHLNWRYCEEREAGHRDSADAVLAGFCDALVGRFGPLVERRRPLLPLVRVAFEAWRRRPRVTTEKNHKETKSTKMQPDRSSLPIEEGIMANALATDNGQMTTDH